MSTSLFELPCEPARLELRPLQEHTLQKVRAAWQEGARNVLVQAPCGFGKTEIATAMLLATHENNRRGAFVCDRISLINQTSDRFERYGLAHGVIQADNPKWEQWRRIQVCSVQTLTRRRTWPETDLLIIDEAHILGTAVKAHLAKRDCRAIGLTATPFTKGLGLYFDVLVNAATTNQLIREGWLTPFKIYSASEPDMTGVKVVNGEYEEQETERRCLPIVGDCVKEYIRLGEGRKFVAFAVSVAHAESLQQQFMVAGIQCALYTYRQGDDQKAAAIEEFRKPDSYLRGLISIESLTRGFDVPDVGVLILARPLRSSLHTHIQMLGRVLRTAEGKTDALVLDHAANCVRFWDQQCEYLEEGWHELDDGSKKAKRKVKKQPEPKKCPQCHHIHKPNRYCPACGFEYPRQANVRQVDGELRELAGHDSTPDQRKDLYAQLLYIAQEKGRKLGWAAYAFKERVGQFPRGTPEPQLPTRELRSWVLSRDIAWRKRPK